MPANDDPSFDDAHPGCLVMPDPSTNIYGPLAQVFGAPMGIYLVVAAYEGTGIFWRTCYVIGPKNGYIVPSVRWKRVA